MPDPWTTPGRPHATRYVCPLEDWYFDEPTEPPHFGIVGYEGRAKDTEAMIRQHLEEHTLDDWVKAATELATLRGPGGRSRPSPAARTLGIFHPCVNARVDVAYGYRPSSRAEDQGPAPTPPRSQARRAPGSESRRKPTMRTQTLIFSVDDSHRIATLEGPLTLPVGTTVVIESRRYVVTEPPEIHVDKDPERDEDRASICVTVKPA